MNNALATKAQKLGLTSERLIELAQGAEPNTAGEKSAAAALADGFKTATNTAATFAATEDFASKETK